MSPDPRDRRSSGGHELSEAMLKHTEEGVAKHYTKAGLEQAITSALVAAGKDIMRLRPADLAPVDEFHVGGREATADLASHLGFSRAMHVLDVGSGIGGPSRYFAEVVGCRVTGVDLTEEYVRVAGHLAQRVGLASKVTYKKASALALPFQPGTFDGAYMMHVGMNIEPKARLFSEVRRVLKPGSLFGIYDMMRIRDGELAFPMPWAMTPELSFVVSEPMYRKLLEGAKFKILQSRTRREFASESFRQMRTRAAEEGPSPLGLHILMGPSTPLKISNMIANLDRGLMAPVDIICEARK
jgi:ubiquinone/menaquinone biosynthesis C-methylase UbiE